MFTHFLDRLKSHPYSSSPLGHCFFPSHNAALETHLSLKWQWNERWGQFVIFSFLLKTHSSSDASEQSGLPSQTKNQLMQTPLLRHCIQNRIQFDVNISHNEENKRKKKLNNLLGTFLQHIHVSWHYKIQFLIDESSHRIHPHCNMSTDQIIDIDECLNS